MRIISELCHDVSLSSFVDFHQRNFAYDPLIIWNLEHKCLYASEIYLSHVGLDSLNGKLLSEISDEYAILSSEFRVKITRKVLESKKPHRCFFLLRSRLSNDYGMFQASIFPLFDDEGILIAYCTRSYQIRHDAAIFNMMREMFSYKRNYELLKMDMVTEREKIVIFLLIIGLSHKEIANVLTNIYNKEISSSSVGVMVSRQIYPKFDTNNFSTLVHRAISNGMLYNIPSSLVEKIPRVIFVEEYAALSIYHGLEPLGE